MKLDKKFFYRLKFYGLGFGLGCIIVWAMLIKDRERDSWLPEGRVITFLRDVDMDFNSKAKCLMDCYQLDESFMDEEFWKKADVDFDKSAAHRKPCPEYYISSTLADGQQVIVYIESCETCIGCEEEGVATLRSIELSGSSASCNCN